jgi:hypothetical protein
MALSTDLESKGLADHALERRDVPRRRPHFQLRVAAGSDLQQAVVAAIVQLDGRDGLLMTAIEAFGQPQNRRQRANGSPAFPAELAEAVVTFLRRRLAVIAGDERHRFDLLRVEPSKIAVLDQVIRVLVVALVADVHADVV